MERLKFHQENQEGTFHNIELDSDSTSKEEGEFVFLFNFAEIFF